MRIIHREDQEEQAHEALSPDASFADESEGRARSAEPDILRNDYQRDRDKILHTKSFRRLSHKTQVFLAAEGDHFRTRLTHTLEVAQIARTIARALGLNEDLTEAISRAAKARARWGAERPLSPGGRQGLPRVRSGVIAGTAPPLRRPPFRRRWCKAVSPRADLPPGWQRDSDP